MSTPKISHMIDSQAFFKGKSDAMVGMTAPKKPNASTSTYAERMYYLGFQQQLRSNKSPVQPVPITGFNKPLARKA